MRSFVEALRYCRWLTRRAGSNFTLSFALLSPERRAGMEVLYAYCRAIDDVVDQGDLTEAEARAQLSLWRRELRACEQGFATHPIGVALQSIRKQFDLPLATFEKVIAGVEMDLRPRRYETFEQLKHYCEHVASAVGLVSVRIFGCRHPASDRYARELGMAFQMTNILRDLKADAQQGRVYLPVEDLRRFGCVESQLLEGRVDEPLRNLIAFECGRTREFFRQAEEAARESGEGRQLLSARIMSAIYRELLRLVEERPSEIFTSRIRVSPRRQLWLALRCLLTSSS